MKTILILGKLPPPLMGPSIATEIILKSSLKEKFNLIHLDTKINRKIETMGRWRFSKLFKSVSIYFEFSKKIRSYRPDIILVPIGQTTMGFLKDAPFMWLGAFFGKKVLIQLRGSNFLNWLNSSTIFVRWLVKMTLKKCVGVIVLGNNLKYLFRNYFDDDNIYVVPNGGNYQLVEGKKEKELTVLYLANFLPSKSFDDILQAIVILKQKGITNFNVKAAGAWDNNDFKEKCLNIINKNKLENVDLFSPQSGESKMQLFADSDIFIFCPKMPEGHPWVIVEALANGLPIIATDQGAIVESVSDGENGFIVDAESPNKIAIRLEELLTNEDLRRKMGDKSHTIYEQNFTEENMVKNLTLVFQKIME